MEITNSSSINFDGLLENRFSKIICVAFTFTVVSLLAPLFYAVIWYERFGSDNHRTLVDRLSSLVVWMGLFDLLVARVGDILNYTVGPFPSLICYFQVYVKVIRKLLKELRFVYLVIYI
jgi:hypothetical protein